MPSDAVAALIGAGGAVAGGALAGFVALRTALPYRKQAAVQRQAALVSPRLESYNKLVPLLLPYRDDRGEPRNVPLDERKECARLLRTWYYTQGGALLLTGDAFIAYRDAHKLLLDPEASAEAVSDALSRFRTELKLDIGTRQREERDVQFARSAERGW
jgi:hypothetical protein